MKVVALTLLLAAMAQARVNYHLKCARDEIGIRWPSYLSNSEYYVCQGVNGRQMTIQCNPGEVFTFVLQQCTSPSLFIPPPPIDVLPTSVPPTIVEQPGISIQYPQQPGQPNNQNIDNGNMQPPIFGMDGNPVELPHMPVEMPHGPIMGEPSINHMNPPVAAPVEIIDTPPTPPPTPGIVKPPAPNKKPVPNKKPSPPVPSGIKKPAAPQAAPKKPAPKPAPKKPAPPSRA